MKSMAFEHNYIISGSLKKTQAEYCPEITVINSFILSTFVVTAAAHAAE